MDDPSLLIAVPLSEASTYTAPWFFPSAHWQTILPNVTRRRIRVEYRRERFELPDSDFMDLDWLESNPVHNEARCCIILHGLEGDSHAPYVKSMARSFQRSGYAVGALNLRGCSGKPNRLKRFYHSGDTEGLAFVLDQVSARYDRISLVGFSLGGNVLLKYLGEDSARIPKSVRSAAAFSVPCDLAGAADCLAESRNAFYMKRFIKLLGAKLREKEKKYQEYEYEEGYSEMKSFHEFDNVYTARLNGFRDAIDYWSQSSCKQYLNRLDRPALLVNARNDPFLSDSCFPREIAQSSSLLHLEIPASGGHCGFPGRKAPEGYWHERRALSFFAAQGNR
mgnify:FL=1